jgi:uncharacterized coiled-coil protein SlyX
VTESLDAKLSRLETLFTEQDYTIQALNNMVAQQDKEISRLNINVEQLKIQLQSLKADASSDIDPGFEKPPHY